jgi:hypothetical protein
VPETWGGPLASFTECFASPFNHKLPRYYSMFEQDKDFGSLGNFFVMLAENDGVLPAGRYEINPPWMNAMYEKLAKILRNSLDRHDLTVIVVAPQWTDTKWVPAFHQLVKKESDYKANSKEIRTNFEYVQDMSKKRFKQKTVTWIFTKKAIPQAILSHLGLV